MNKIEVVNNKINSNIDDSIILEKVQDDINKLSIKIIKDTSLEIYYNTINSKLDISLELNSNVKLNLFELKQGNKIKIKNKYILNENSYLKLDKFNDIDNINENIIINLNGKNSKIDYNFKTISILEEQYFLNIYHNNINTISNIKNNGVVIKEGSIVFNVSSFVPDNITGCKVKQNNRIINLTNNKCQINPNLYIDCNDVEASHSALIGTFNDSELFYLQSRGISYDDALLLLIKGFLLSNINKDLDEIIDKYWR